MEENESTTPSSPPSRSSSRSDTPHSQFSLASTSPISPSKAPSLCSSQIASSSRSPSCCRAAAAAAAAARFICPSSHPSFELGGGSSGGADETSTCSSSTTSQETRDGAYAYTSPLTSPFYKWFLSPVCNWVCERFIPDFVTPDMLSLAGLFCACAAVVAVLLATTDYYSLFVSYFSTSCSFSSFFTHIYSSGGRRNIMFGIAGFLWMLYSIFDNLDGKQARRLGTSSSAGEFIDHAIDSIVVSLCGIVWTRALLGFNVSWIVIWAMTIAGQIPFYLGTWAHHILGHILLGSSITGSAWLTVDEFNFLFVPALCFVRALFPSLWDRPVLQLLAPQWFTADSDMGLGTVLVLSMILYSVMESFKVLRSLVTWKSIDGLLPLVAYSTLVWIYRPPFLLLVAPFSLLCMEIICRRLRLHVRTRLYLWWPNMLLLLTLLCLYPPMSTHNRWPSSPMEPLLDNSVGQCVRERRWWSPGGDTRGVAALMYGLPDKTSTTGATCDVARGSASVVEPVVPTGSGVIARTLNGISTSSDLEPIWLLSEYTATLAWLSILTITLFSYRYVIASRHG